MTEETPAFGIVHERHPAPGYVVSGQPTEAQIVRARALGLGRIITLRTGAEPLPCDEPAIARTSGIGYDCLPVGGIADLSKATVDAFDALLARPGEGITLLHCATGNRVGILMALRAGWLQGKPVAEAMEIGRNWGLADKAEADVQRLLDAGTPSA